jgi:hypothetical protein
MDWVSRWRAVHACQCDSHSTGTSLGSLQAFRREARQPLQRTCKTLGPTAIPDPPVHRASNRMPWKTACFSAGRWVPYRHRTIVNMVDYFLVDLADGVVHLPEGEGARLLTRAIRLALNRGDYNVKLSQTRQYIRENLLMFPSLPSLVGQMRAGRHPDTEAILRARVNGHTSKNKQ